MLLPIVQEPILTNTYLNFDSTYSSVFEISNNSSNIEFENMIIKSNPYTELSSHLESAKLVSIIGYNNMIKFNNTTFSGGAVSIYANPGSDSNSNNISITNSFFNNFAVDGASLTGVKNLYINNNKFRQMQ